MPYLPSFSLVLNLAHLATPLFLFQLTSCLSSTFIHPANSLAIELVIYNVYDMYRNSSQLSLETTQTKASTPT